MARQWMTVEIADIQIDDVERMDVGVDEARQHQAACEFFHARVGTDPALRLGRGADEHHSAVPDRERCGDGTSGVDRIDIASFENQVGRRLPVRFGLRHRERNTRHKNNTASEHQAGVEAPHEIPRIPRAGRYR
jgi:hypothetical protein